MEEARSQAPAMMKIFKERTRDLKKEKWRLLEEKQKKKQQKDQRQVSERANLVEGVMRQGGMWKNKEQIEVELAKMDDDDDENVRRAIFQQLNFHQKVLQVKAPRQEMFQLTTTVDGRKKVFSKEEMRIHLTKIVEANNLDSTGFGKSVIFQAAPFCVDYLRKLQYPDLSTPKSMVIVVMPLKSLISDQLNRAKDMDIKAADVTGGVTDHIIEAIPSGKFSILYASPESLLEDEGRELFDIPALKDRLCGLVIDESHCVTKW